MADKRHELRYQRRRQAREQKKAECAAKYSIPENVFGMQAIADGYKRVRRQSRWKASTQSYGAYLFTNAAKESDDLLSGRWKPKGFYEFDIVERGKPRHIRSIKVSEKCVQAALTDKCLIPVMSRNLIYDNGACLPGKGTDFTLNRLTEHLRWHYQHYGMEGGILLYDFHGYFDSILHRPLEEMAAGTIRQPLITGVYCKCIDAFDKPETAGKGLGLGSHVSQISAVAYCNPIDHWIKDQLGIHGYARYNDDGYVICYDLEKLKEIARELRIRAAELGIEMNEKKFHVIPFGRPFRFLKVRFFITDTGKIVKRIARGAAVKERHKLRKLHSLMEEGRKPYAEINQEFHSWLCSQNRGKNFHIMVNMIRYYDSLFSDQGGYQVLPLRRKAQNRRLHQIRAAKRMSGLQRETNE